MSRRVEHYKTPGQSWGSSTTIEIATFYEGEIGLRLHHCYDPANPHATHEECADIVMDRRFALRKALTLARFALGLYRRDRHSVRLTPAQSDEGDD